MSRIRWPGSCFLPNSPRRSGALPTWVPDNPTVSATWYQPRNAYWEGGCESSRIHRACGQSAVKSWSFKRMPPLRDRSGGGPLLPWTRACSQWFGSLNRGDRTPQVSSGSIEYDGRKAWASRGSDFGGGAWDAPRAIHDRIPEALDAGRWPTDSGARSPTPPNAGDLARHSGGRAFRGAHPRVLRVRRAYRR